MRRVLASPSTRIPVPAVPQASSRASTTQSAFLFEGSRPAISRKTKPAASSEAAIMAVRLTVRLAAANKLTAATA